MSGRVPGGVILTGTLKVCRNHQDGKGVETRSSGEKSLANTMDLSVSLLEVRDESCTGVAVNELKVGLC